MTEAARPWNAPDGWTIHPGYAARRCADGTEFRVQVRRERSRDRARGQVRPMYWELRRYEADAVNAWDRGETVQGERPVLGYQVQAGEHGRGQPEAALFRLADAAAKSYGGWA